MEVDSDLEQLMSHLGEFGRYQGIQFVLHILAAMTAGLHMLTLVTVAAVPEHRCAVPGVDVNGTVAPWDSPDVLNHIPVIDGHLDSCHIRDTFTNKTMTCDHWVYNSSYYGVTKAVEWNSVCQNRWKGAVAQGSYMFGVFVGAVILGSLADKYGRKKIFCISAVLQLILGVGVAFVTNYYTFLFIRFIYGIFGSAGSYITGFVMSMEIIGPSKRTACGVTFQALFAVGVMLVAFWGYLIKDVTILQVVYGLHGLLLIPHWFLVDESPRWLWAQGRVSEAVKIVERGAKMNKNEPVDVASFVSKGNAAAAKQETKSYSLLDLFKTPNLRNKTLNVCLNWFANSLAYYGLSLNTGHLSGNPFLILFVLGFVELPSYVGTVFLMDRTGRRPLISSLMLLGGICCIISTYIPQETLTGSTAAITVVMFGKFFIAGSFAIIYNYTAELFPTVVRNTALGVGSMCARLSGTLTPLITLLDSFDKTIPPVIFATIAIASGLLSLLLPETLNKPMPQTIEDGENFGKGDTACVTCCNSRRQRYEVPLSDIN